MSNNRLYIPKTLHVGYQERRDTYTKKLAYVIYTDDKGVKRKETSWKGWCRKFLEDQENVPTEGFILNKGVGGARQSWGWNARNEYIRVYDPRGWEFEISVSNLLFILQECTSTKGKGLEGEFVYSWDGKELVLLPVGCEEYKESTEHTSLQSKKVTKKDMKEGKWYTFKNGDVAVYLGRHLSSEVCQYGSKILGRKHHVFRLENGTHRLENGFTKLAAVGEICDDYGNYLEEFLSSKEANPIVDLRWESVTLKSGVQGRYYIKGDDGEVYEVYLSSAKPHNRYSWHELYRDFHHLELEFLEPITTTETFFKNKGGYYGYSNHFYYEDTMNLVTPVFILANGKEKR